MKTTRIALAGALLISPVLVNAQSVSFNLKDAIKKGIAEGKKTGDAPNGNSSASVETTTSGVPAATMDARPKVLETFGIKLGDTPQQAEQVLTSQGYKFSQKMNYLLGPNFLGVLSTLEFRKVVPLGGGYTNESIVQVQFGPRSGKAVYIWRKEKFDKLVVASEMRKALIEKYGNPSSQASTELNWIAYQPTFTYRGNDLDVCKARGVGSMAVSSNLTPYKDCKYAVSATLSDFGNSQEFRTIDVSVGDFSVLAVELASVHEMSKRKDAEILEEHKKAPLPKL